MRVEIIDDTHQRFNGVTYHKNKRGWFQTPYSTIHRDVWAFHNGEIPEGCDIHHVDFDKANNQIENLQCLTRAEHRRLHNPPKQHDLTCSVCGKHFVSDDKNRKRCPECLAEYKRQCEEKRQAKLNKPPKAPKPPRTKICVVCGKEFELRPKESSVHGRTTCSKECHDKICPPLQDKNCVVCGNVFQPKHAKQKCCSPDCAAKFNSGEKVARVISHCEFCGKEIIHRPGRQPRFCSRDCLNRFMSVSRKGINPRNEKNPLTRA